jgi:hypothetical protein
MRELKARDCELKQVKKKLTAEARRRGEKQETNGLNHKGHKGTRRRVLAESCDQSDKGSMRELKARDCQLKQVKKKLTAEARRRGEKQETNGLNHKGHKGTRRRVLAESCDQSDEGSMRELKARTENQNTGRKSAPPTKDWKDNRKSAQPKKDWKDKRWFYKRLCDPPCPLWLERCCCCL